MKLQVPSGILNGALSVARLASGRYNPLLANVHMLVVAKTLRCTGTDGTMWMSHMVGCEDSVDGEILAPAGLLSDLAAKMSGDVTLALDGDRLVMSAGRSRVTLPTASAADYPDPSALAMTPYLTIPCQSAKLLLQKTLPCAKKPETGHEAHYTGCSIWAVEGPELRVAAVDDIIVGFATAECQPAPDAAPMMLPYASAATLLSMLPDSDTKLTVRRGSGGVEFAWGGAVLRCPLYDLDVPPLHRVMPSPDATKLYLKREDFKIALTRLLPLYDLSSNPRAFVDMTGVGPLELATFKAEHGEGRDEVALGTELAEPTNLRVNAKYMLLALSQLSGPDVLLRIGGTNIAISDPRDANLLYVTNQGTKE